MEKDNIFLNIFFFYFLNDNNNNILFLRYHIKYISDQFHG